MVRSTQKVPFEKFHGLGNDFIVVSGRGLPSSFLRALAREITDRHTGVGADGFIVVLPARRQPHDARVRFFNADGSEAEMSGNGIRCAAAFLTGQRKRNRLLRIETAAGLKVSERVSAEKGSWIFRVGMGKPIFDPRKIPFKAAGASAPIVGFPLRTRRGLLPVCVTSMGNPHCTLFVGDFAGIDWPDLGREIERSELFPRRTNVEFVKVISGKEIEVRFWERGVGETASSGTGSCGAVVACVLSGLTERDVRVRTKAGTLHVVWPDNGEVMLTGPVERVAKGIYDCRRSEPRRRLAPPDSP